MMNCPGTASGVEAQAFPSWEIERATSKSRARERCAKLDTASDDDKNLYQETTSKLRVVYYKNRPGFLPALAA